MYYTIKVMVSFWSVHSKTLNIFLHAGYDPYMVMGSKGIGRDLRLKEVETKFFLQKHAFSPCLDA